MESKRGLRPPRARPWCSSGVDGRWLRCPKRGSRELAIVVPRRSWRGIFAGNFSAQKFLGDGGDVAPVPKIPRNLGRRKENSSYGKCAQENCLTRGVHLKKLCPILCHTRLKILPAEAVYGLALRFHSDVREFIRVADTYAFCNSALVKTLLTSMYASSDSAGIHMGLSERSELRTLSTMTMSSSFDR